MTNFKSDIKLGERYRDRITGLEGTADSVHFYRNACERARLVHLHDGEIKEAYFDAPDLIHVDSGAQASSPRTGGPARSMPPRR
jgi:hypothetical protein